MANVTDEKQSNIIFTPGQAHSRLAQYADMLQNTPGIPYPGAMHSKTGCLPLRPTEIEFWAGRPGMGKTSIMLWRALDAARLLKSRGEADKKTVLFFSWEQPIESLAAYMNGSSQYTPTDLFWGDVSLKDVVAGGSEILSLPIQLGGWSLMDRDRPKQKMTMTAITDAIKKTVDEFKKEPFHIVLDYLQIMDVESAKENRQAEVSEAAYSVKRLALELGCSVSIGAQAKPGVDEKQIKVPGMGDIWYTSVLDMVGDKVFGISRPIRWQNQDLGDKLAWAGKSWEVMEALFLIQLNKQRGGPGQGQWAMHFDINRMTLGDLNPVGGMAVYQTNGVTPF